MTSTVLAVLEIPAPVIDWRALAPLLIMFGAAVAGILVEALVPARFRDETQLGLMIGAVLAAGGYSIANWRQGRVGPEAMGSIMLDGPTYLSWLALLVFGGLAMLLFAERKVHGGVSTFASSAATVPGSKGEAEADRARMEQTEVLPLGVFALLGMMVFVSANDLITLFVALEVFSLPLYIMCAMARRRRLLSQESALKYVLLGALSSGFFLFGIALLYGYSGSFDLKTIDVAVSSPVFGRGLLFAGLALLAIGLLFKVGVVPFHSWIPDVYTGAPTPVTGFMAICTKLAAVVATARVFYVALGAERWSWQPIFAVLAALTMVVGVVMALVQTDIKRLLAYSSIAHAGFILTALAGANQIVRAGQTTSVASILFYLIAYGFATVGAFAIVTMVRNATGEENSLDGWAGLGRRSPWLAGLMSVFMLSFAGIPLTGGFIGKFAVFAAAWRGGYWWLVGLAVLLSIAAAWIYLKVIVAMFFRDPARGTHVGEATLLTWIPIVIGAVATVYLGVFPDQAMHLASLAGTFLR